MRRCLLYFALLIFGFSYSQNVPVAYDLSVSFYKDSSGIIQLVGSDQDGDDLTYVIYTVCSGTIQYNDDGVFQAPGSTSDHGRLIYKPYKTSEYNYFVNGTDTFEYLVRDEDGDSARATVTIKVYDEYLNPPTPIGEIDGEAEGDNFGHSISFSENGSIMAVGAPNNDADFADSEKGSVRVYQYSGSGTDWQQIGNDIDGSNDGDEFGSSVSLSGDGKTLAVGIPENDDAKANSNPGQVKVYSYDSGSTTWNLTATISPNITNSGINKKVSEQFGHDVRLSLDGKTLAVSDIWFDKNGGNNAGRVMVYKYDGTTWNAISGELELAGESSDNASWGIALSSRGDILAVGIHEDDDGGTNAGKVVVYEYNKSSNSWDIRGTLLGSSSNEKFGAALDINSDGSTIVVGAPHFRENNTRSYLGKVKVFKWDGSAYSILGQELVGSDKYDYFGAQLSIDSQGSTIAVMGPGHDANPGTTSGSYLKKGRVRVYNYNETSTSWIQTPTTYDFDGEADGDQSTGVNKESRGQAAVLSADGSLLAYGANENDGNGSNSGHVRMYRLFETQIKPTVTSKSVSFELYEQVTSSEEITLDGSDPDSGPSDLVYIITQLETAKLFEGDTEITKSDIPYTLTGNKVKYNSNSDTVVNDEFYFIAQDGKASSCPGRIQLTVIPDNDAPKATAQESLTTDEDVAISITLAGTDVDSPTSDFTYIIGTLPSNGTLKQGDTEINAAETTLTGTDINYTPNSNYSGNDSFTFKIKDKGVNSDGVTDVETSAAANISITVNNTDNDPPVAENKSISAGQDTETSAITLVASDPDSDNSTLIYSIASLPSNGILKDGGTEITGAADLTGALTYLPNDGYAGSDSFTFTAKDDQSAVSAAATVSISVSDTNDPPIATAKSITVDEDVESETIVLEATDPDATDTTFTFFIASLPSNGTLKDNGTIITGPTQISGALTYLSNTNYVGDDSFTFTAKDDESAESTAATVSITVNNTNDPPVADNQSVTTREDTITNPVITLTATDPDTSDTSFTFTIKSLPTNGVLKDGDSEINTVDTDLSSATLTYTPNLNYNGSDSFTFTAKDDESAISSSATLSLTVSPWNDPPVANSQDLTTDENVDLSITVSGTDVDGDTLTYVLYTLPSNGTLKQGDTTIQASDIPLTLSSNDFTYVPNSGFNGADSFKFKVRDLTPDSFATANSMELIKNAGTPITYETEYGKTYFLIQSTPTKMDWPDAKVLTDSYYGARMYVVINADMEKAVYDALQSMNRLDGPFWMGLYQDRNAADYSEPSGGWYWVNGNKLGDGYTNWHAGEPNDAGNEDYGQFNFSDFGIEWNDMAVGNGQSYALFEFTAEDSTADINITVSEFNDPPVATPQSVSTDEDVELDITLAGTDSESSTLSYIVSELPTNGELKDGSETIKTDDLPKTLSSSSIKYIPNNYYNGSDSFKFKVKDTGNADGSNKKESSDALVSITINSINNKPVPTPQTSLKTNEDTPIEITHAGTDPDGDNLDFLIVTLPNNGKLEDNGTEITSGDLPKKLTTEKVTYTPNDNFNGADSYTFKVNDGTVDSDTAASIELTINNVNDPPTADNQSLKTNEDTELKITLTGSDPENDPLTYIIKTLPTYGKLKESGNIILESELPKLLPADSITYVPDANYIGNDSFDFMINANYLNSFSKANDLKFITQDGEPVTYQKPEGKTYFLIQENTGVSGSPIDWTTAKELTNSIDGAKMYVILNAEMELLVWNGLKSMGLTGQAGLYYWIGLYQDRNAADYSEPSGGWYWDDGVKLGSAERPYTNWYQNEPNNAGDEDYAQFEFSSNGPDGIKWNDMSIGNAQSWPLFEFSISGSSDSNTAKISIDVQEVNDPPIAENFDLSMEEDGELNVTMNATDPEGAIEMNYVIKSLPKNGKISENSVEIKVNDIPKTLSGKTVKYEPNQDFNGFDNFTYNAIDKNCPNTNTSKLEVTGDFTASATGTNPMIIPPQNIKGSQNVNQKQVDIKFTVGQGDIFQSCEIKLDVKSFDDGLQFTIDGVNLLSFSQKHWDPAFGANTTEFSGSGRFVTNGNLWQPWLGDGNPKLEIATGKIKLMVDTRNGTREDAIPFMDPSGDSNWAKVNSFTYDCEAGFNLLIGNHNGGGGAGGIDADLTVEAYIVPCEESNIANISIGVNAVNDPPQADGQTVNTDEDLAVDITHVGRDNDLVDIFTSHKQRGSDIKLPQNWAEFIELSADGNKMVVGGWTNNKVRVLSWSGTSWVQLGSDIEGSASGDNFGEFVSISSDGKRIAVGAHQHDNSKGEVRVFEWDGTSWNQLGSPMDGASDSDEFSYRGVHISGDGNTIAAASFKGGYVDIYRWSGTSWVKTGNILITNSSGDDPGQLSLSYSGNRVAIGYHTVNENNDKGKLKIFDWNGTSWVQYAAIDGKNNGDELGSSVSISRDGKNLAVGANGAGIVRVYDVSSSVPNQVGNDIDYGNNAAWRAISLSDDGKRVAIPQYSIRTGVFDWVGSEWKKLGEDLLATADEGESLDMSGNGQVLATGGHSGLIKVFNVLNLTYIITSLPSNGILKEGNKTITASDLPFALIGTDATYTPNSGFYGTDEYNFKVNDGKIDSNTATVKINIKEFLLDLPNNYKITTTETCKGSDFGIIDIEVVATSYKKTPAGPEIPITYNVAIEGKGSVGKIVSPSKTLQIVDLPEGTHKLVFTVESEPKYENKEDATIIATDPPAAYPVDKFETCDDDKDNDDANGKANFDTTTLIDKLLTNPGTGTMQDQNLFEFEFTYFDEATSAIVTKSTLPNPFYSANQTISVKFKSKINGKCEATQNIDFQVNTLPVFERIEDNKSVCLNLPAITIGVKSSDSRSYTYTWTRDGTDFPPNINGTDSSILVGLGGEYVVTATTTDGTNCSKTMKITLSESEIATFVKKDVEIKDLYAGPNNTITVLTTTLGIGDYEYALDDITGPYQDDPIFEKVRPGKHTVFVRDKNGCGTVSMDIWVIGFKKFFTPNGDGYTDFWNIIGITDRYQANSKIYIFDRFGKLLKELDPLSPGWNGNFNGKPMPQTDYWFKVILEDGRTFEGHFSLVRGW